MEDDSSNEIRLVERGQFRKDKSTVFTSLPQLPANTRVLHLDYLYPPHERLEQWQDQDDISIEEITILYAGYHQQQQGVVEKYGKSIGCETSFSHISNPKDIERAGLEITKFLDRQNSEEYPTLITVDSLSVMLQYVSLNSVVQFTRHCISLFEQNETIGRFYISPQTHTEETNNTIQSLFY
ncbi:MULTISPECIES: DUF7504 family protein [Halobellus]|uniref:DUF7504 family protein n=1 Tax=Halobellus TaxID=1073986 RepID=UPI00119D3491|nr:MULTISPECIES: hypothetical protein [Halobellus]